MKDLAWVKLCQKDYAFNKAIEDFYEGVAFPFEDARLEKCITYNNYSQMTPMCVTILNEAYPRPDIAEIAEAHGVTLEEL